MARMIHGVHRILEDEADRLIHESLKGVTSYEAKSDILTPWKEKNRAAREVLTPTGFPESASRQGMYHRKANATRPDLNSRDGISRSKNHGQGWARTYAEEYGHSPNEA